MQEWRPTFFRNPAAVLTALGLLLLAFTIWMPWLTASRTARVERRAESIGAALAATVAGNLVDPAALDVDVVVARALKLAEASATYVADLERIEPTPPDVLLLLRNKHYWFHLAVSPPMPNEVVGRGTMPTLEVVAWPLSAAGPGHSCFFFPEDALRSYTRNLSRGYAGLDKRPKPAAAHRRNNAGTGRPGGYRSTDNERWILF
jgi:hypothetical protein